MPTLTTRPWALPIIPGRTHWHKAYLVHFIKLRSSHLYYTFIVCLSVCLVLAFTACPGDAGFKSWSALGLAAIRSHSVDALLVVVTHVRALGTLIYICMAFSERTAWGGGTWFHLRKPLYNWWLIPNSPTGEFLRLSPWHVLVSGEMVKPEGQAQEKPPMMLLQEWEQGDWRAHSSSSNEGHIWSS